MTNSFIRLISILSQLGFPRFSSTIRTTVGDDKGSRVVTSSRGIKSMLFAPSSTRSHSQLIWLHSLQWFMAGKVINVHRFASHNWFQSFLCFLAWSGVYLVVNFPNFYGSINFPWCSRARLRVAKCVVPMEREFTLLTVWTVEIYEFLCSEDRKSRRWLRMNFELRDFFNWK